MPSPTSLVFSKYIGKLPIKDNQIMTKFLKKINLTL